MAGRPVTFSMLVATLAIVLALVWFGQRSLLYFPDSELTAPADLGLIAVEPAEFRTSDGLDLGGWFVPAAGIPSGYTVLVFNGNAGNRAYRAPLALRLSRLGVAVFLFDYRGYGGNPGLPYEAGLARDAEAALAYLRPRPDVDPARIVYFGESLGTGVAVELATRFQPAALILRSPFTSLVEVATHLYPFLPSRWLLRDRYPSARRMAHVRAPVVVIAGTADRIVPFDDSEALFELAHTPKWLVRVEHADHNDDALTHGPVVIEAIAGVLGLGPRLRP